jgi:hypothetical protein
MRTVRLLPLLFLLVAAGLPAAAEKTAECSLCAGITGHDGLAAATPVLARVADSELAGWAPAEPQALTITVDIATDPGTTDVLESVDARVREVVGWAQKHGPFDGIGLRVRGDDPRVAAYAMKRLTVLAQGLGIAKRIVLPMTPFEPAAAAALFEQGAGAYFDALLVNGPEVEAALAFLMERDPSKKVWAIVPASSPNVAFDLARAFAAGATRAYADSPDTAALAPALDRLNAAFTGDWAHDSTAKVPVLDAKGAPAAMPVLAFVRGEDLRTILIPAGDAAAAAILTLPADRYGKPRRLDASGEREITDTGRRGSSLLVGMPATRNPFAVVVDHVEKPVAGSTKETIDVATERGITVEEIIRNHQAYDAFQESVQPRYIARNTTKLRFDIGGGAEALEAAIAGDYFSAPDGRADWVWQDFYVNGVKWKYGRIPELPLIQPEKVTQLPLDIHLTNDYRYELIRATDLLGYRVYEVRFEPPVNAPKDLPLYRGTVFIDAKSWARVRISMIQLNLTGEVLSNEERVDFTPFARETGQPVGPEIAKSADPHALIWLPREVAAQQVISAAGRASVVERSTAFENFRLDPPEFETLLAQASASDARMVRETESGLRYLEKKDGQRVVKEGFDTAQLFVVGGIHHDDGLDYPVVPLGGVDYFNFNLFGRGIQTNVFFAGVVLAANATHPNVGNTRTNVGVDFFGIAVPTENTMYRDGEERPEESVKSLPTGLFLRAGHPFLQFGKVDVSLGVSHQSFSRADDTATSFEIPSSTFTLTPGIEVRYARRGYTLSASYDYNRRSTWEQWGDPAEWSPEQKTFTHFGVSAGKSFYLPKFQRIGVDVSWLDGQRLDRFSKYELGFFGSRRVHGVRSGSVRAEEMILGHLSYGFVFSDQFRLEALYDHALITDAASGLEREPYQGVGIAGQTIGPWGTLLRLDIGKTIGRNRQNGFVANVVFLKLF